MSGCDKETYLKDGTVSVSPNKHNALFQFCAVVFAVDFEYITIIFGGGE